MSDKVSNPLSESQNVGDSDEEKTTTNRDNAKNTTDEADNSYRAIVSLPEVEIDTLEGNESEILKMKCKLYRFQPPLEEDDSPEWKERGVGDVKLMRHNDTNKFRIIMRRDKTLKVCANHYITSKMKLIPLGDSDKALIWNTQFDYSDDIARPETLCIRFENLVNTENFKDKFMSCVDSIKSSQNPVIDKLDALNIEDTTGNLQDAKCTTHENK